MSNSFYRKVYNAIIKRNPLIRKIETKNGKIGKVAIGEQLGYDFPRDWIKIDYRRADFNIDLNSTFVLPFKSSSINVIYTSHTIEHLSNDRVCYLLQECYRILKPGGVIRVEVPDVEKLVQLYKTKDNTYLKYFKDFYSVLVDKFHYPQKYTEDHLGLVGTISNYIPDEFYFQVPVYVTEDECNSKLTELELEEFCEWCISIQTEQQLKSGGHKSYFYFDRLFALMSNAGFRDIERVDFNMSKHEHFKLNQGKGSIIEKPHRRFFSLYVEAEKLVENNNYKI